MITTRTPYWVQILVSLGLVAGVVLSPKLWLSARLYPLTPAPAMLRPIPPPFDLGVLVVLGVLLVWATVAPKSGWALAGFIALAAGYSLWDQSRWQPWFYQYLWMLGVLYVFRRDPDSALNTCRVIVAAVYFWSGVHKFNTGFVNETFPWMLEPFPLLRGLERAAILVPVIEAAIGAGLMIRSCRRAAVGGAIAMHAFVLVCIGPLGHNWDNVIWPWNVAMAGLVVLLFWRGEFKQWRARPTFAKVVVFAFGVAPALSVAGVLDGYLGFSLYSGNRNQATIYMADSVADRLPGALQELITVNDSGVDELDVFEWSFAELNAPPYAEPRIFRNVGKRVCALAGNPREMALVIRTKSAFLHRRRAVTYDCAGLSGQAAPVP